MTENNQAAPVKKKSANNIVIAVVLACVLGIVLGFFIIFMLAFIGSKADPQPSPTIEPQPVPVLTLEDVENTANPSEEKEIINPATSLDEMLFVINGVEYQFPIKVTDLTANGWNFVNEELSAKKIETDDYPAAILVSGSNVIKINAFNPTQAPLAATDCFVGMLAPVIVNSFVLPSNITIHESTRFDIGKAYGMPTGEFSDHVYWYYGDYEDLDLFTPDNPVVTLKFDENCENTGSNDNDVVMYVTIEWFDPDAEVKYAERSAE